MLGIIVFTLIVASLIKWIWDRKKSRNTFKEMGVPGPEPTFIFGNRTTINQKGIYETLDGWLKEYGKTFGYFDGGLPTLVTTDLEIAKQVLIKDFNKFHAREDMIPKNPFSKHQNVLFSEGETWKRLRSISSPTFSARKMKEMSPLVNNCIDNFVTLLDEQCDGKPFNIHAEYQRLTMDTIANCAFGIETSCVHDGNNTFLQKGRRAFSSPEPSLFMKISFLLKVLSPRLRDILHLLVTSVCRDNTASQLDYFHSLARSVIQERLNNEAINRVDFVQLMINARESGLKTEQMEISLADDGKQEVDEKKTSIQAKGMVMEEMESQSMIFLLAGFETTSTSLAFLSYQLALNPDVQEKLRNEVDEHFPDVKQCRPDYVSIQKLEYMDMVLKEVLRFHTPASRAINRNCMETCTIKGLVIPKGVNVFVYNHGIHMDPDYWEPEDPHEFVPERFSSSRRSDFDPLAWMPFGAGPRNCIGMRFALLEVKIAMARILKQYVIHRCPETQVPLPVSKVSFRSPTEGIYLTLSKR